MKKTLTISLLFISLCICSNAFATDWYVDKGAFGNNDGTSWENAWESFADIVWGGSGVSGGDTLYISGGSNGKTYAEMLTVGASGTSSSAHITIRTGATHPTLSSGHDGLVTITGAPGSYGISFNGKSHITIDGNNGSTGSYTNANIKVYNTGNTGVYGPSSSDIKLLYVWVDQAGDAKGENGIRVTESTGEVGWCRVEYPYQDGVKIGIINPSGYGLISIHDCLIQNVPDDLMSGDGGVDVYRNTFGPWCDENYGNPGHMDGFQNYDGYVRIWDNVFRAGNQYATSTNAALYITNAFDRTSCKHYRIYNNLFFAWGESYDLGKYYAVWVNDSGGSGYGMDDIVVVNNTFVDWGFAAIKIGSEATDPMTGVIVKNNIVYNCKHTGVGTPLVFSGADWSNSSFDIDKNTINDGVAGAELIAWAGDYYTVSQFNALTSQDGLVDPPAGRQNTNGEPAFVDYTAGGGTSNNLHLASTDTAAKDQGTDLSSLSNMDPTWPDDYHGIPRPQGFAWDIGAYEQGSNDDESPNPPQNPRIL